MSGTVAVAPAEEFPPGETRVLAVGGVAVCVRNVGGEYYAVQHACAHRGGPICDGAVDLPGESRGPTAECDGPVVRCPWHGWEFDLETGEHLGPGGGSLATFDVAVEGGVVRVGPDPTDGGGR